MKTIPATRAEVVRSPRISVIIPAYACADTIAETLESVRTQTLKPHEVLVVDDGSPDGPALDRAIAPYLSDVRLIRQRNAGVSAARNTALRVAEGELVAFLDSDDVWMPRFLEHQVEALIRADAAMVWSDGVYFGSQQWDDRRFTDFNNSATPATLERLLSLESVVLTAGVLARRDAVQNAGCFDETLTHAEDFDLWLRVSREHRIVFNSEVLVRKRVRPQGLSSDLNRLFEAQIRIYGLYAADEKLPSALRDMARQRIDHARAAIDIDAGKKLFLEGRYREATKRLRAANRILRRPRLTAICGAMMLLPWPMRWAYLRWRNEPQRPDVGW